MHACQSVDQSRVMQLYFCPLMSCDLQTVGVWQVSTGQCLKRLKPGARHPVVGLQWHRVSIGEG